jgi:hypoxanthine phosphoribosyltransferase
LKGKKEEVVNEISSPKEYCSWEEVELLTKTVSQKIQTLDKKYDIVLGITNGGIIPARLIARELDINHIQFISVKNKKLFKRELPPLFKSKKYLVVDDILDTGKTFSKVRNTTRILNCDFAFLMSRYRYTGKLSLFIGKLLNHNKWIVFPWEMKSNL